MNKNGSAGNFATFSGHTGAVNAVAVTPDGRGAVSGSQDKPLKVWDLKNGRGLHTLAGSNGFATLII